MRFTTLGDKNSVEKQSASVCVGVCVCAALLRQGAASKYLICSLAQGTHDVQ